MKVLAIILVVVFICSCSRSAGQHHIKAVFDFCEDRGGVFKLSILDTNEVFAHCKDGAVEQVKSNV